jgi:hypothetical protein
VAILRNNRERARPRRRRRIASRSPDSTARNPVGLACVCVMQLASAQVVPSGPKHHGFLAVDPPANSVFGAGACSGVLPSPIDEVGSLHWLEQLLHASSQRQ